MEELGARRERGPHSEALLQVVLDRLHVVIRRALDRFHAPRAVDIEVVCEGRDERIVVGRERRQLGERRVRREHPEPCDLDDHAVADQPVLARERAQRGAAGRVAAVERRDRGQVVELHRVVLRRSVAHDAVQRRAFVKSCIQGASSPQSSGHQLSCALRNTRSGCGMQIVKRPSSVVKPVAPAAEPFGFSG